MRAVVFLLNLEILQISLLRLSEYLKNNQSHDWHVLLMVFHVLLTLMPFAILKKMSCVLLTTVKFVLMFTADHVSDEKSILTRKH